MVDRYTELASILGNMATTIDNSIKRLTDQFTEKNKDDGVQDEMNTRKNKMRAAKTDVQKKKTFVDGQLKSKAYEAGLLGASDSSSTADGAAGPALNQGTLIGVIVAIVAVLLIAGAVAYLVVKKNRGGGA